MKMKIRTAYTTSIFQSCGHTDVLFSWMPLWSMTLREFSRKDSKFFINKSKFLCDFFIFSI